MDAINFGLEVIVPTRSALAEFALATRAKVVLLEMSDLTLDFLETYSHEIDSADRIETYDSKYAAQELSRIWNIGFNRNSITSSDFPNGHIQGERFSKVLMQWFFLQTALNLFQKKHTYKRRLRKLLQK